MIDLFPVNKWLNNLPHIVVVGSFKEGFNFFGPFETYMKAKEWAEGNAQGRYPYFVQALNSPNPSFYAEPISEIGS
tara:strand:+ start:2120 stop:2347 length:228 start_codon:yes stop_codon:yes gene_type:complete